MRKYVDFIFKVGGGGAVVGATVTVRDADNNLVTLYSDDGVTSIANPVVTDENGMFEFYVADGEYTLFVDDGTNDITVSNVQIYDDSEQQPLNTSLTELAAITPVADNLLYFNSGPGLATTPLTAFARTIIDDTDADSVRTTISAARLGANTDITSLTGITGGIGTADYIDFDTAATPTAAVARAKWNDTDGTLDLGLKGGNVTLQVGQELVQMVRNTSGAGLIDGQAVKVTGASGNRMTVSLAKADGDINSATTIGVVTEAIANNNAGFITTFGLVRDIDTSAFAEGAALYLSPTTAGALTATKPVAPQHTVLIGFCVRSHATVGSIFVNVQNGYEIDELHDVKITGTPTAGSLLIRNATDSLWENARLTAGTGISITNADKSVTIASTVSGTVTSVNVSGGSTGLSFSGGPITSSGTITMGGTLGIAYGGTNATTAAGARASILPSFAGNGGKVLAVNAGATDVEYISVGGTGTVTSVNLTAGTGMSVSGGPITTSGSITVTNTAPDQVVSLTAGTGISTSGTYPNFTITNSSPDQVVSLTGGTGISTSGTYPNFTITNSAPDQTVALTAGSGISVTGTYPSFTIAATGGGGSSVNVQTFDTAGSSTWTKPAGCTMVRVILTGGGGGGGSGKRDGTGFARGGGGGGSGGSVIIHTFLASDLGATETVIVGAGGNGGAGQTTNATNGNAGSAGGATTFGSLLRATGGNGGAGGTNGGGSGGAVVSIGAGGDSVAGGIGRAGAAGSPGATPQAGDSAPTGGGGGAGQSASANSTTTGGASSQLAGAPWYTTVSGASGGNGADGSAGTAVLIGERYIGKGGGGAGYVTATAGKVGGAGAQPGGGGGGGSASDNGFVSGAGGAGGDGWARIISW